LVGKDVDVDEFGVPVDTLNITMAVNERKEKIIKPGLGITTDFTDLPESEQRGLSNLPFLALQVTWQSRNFMGGARKLEVSAKVSKGFVSDKFFANYMQAKITFRQPSFILPFTKDAENDLLLTLSGERNNTLAFDELNYEVSPTFIRQLTRQLNMSLTPLAFTKKVLLRTEASDNTDKNFFTTNSRLGFTYNSSNDFFYPNTGFLIYANSDFAGFLLPSDLKYLKLNFDNRKYFGLTRRITMALRLRIGSDIPYYVGQTKTQIPVSEQFYGGGPNSIRGWGIKELGVIEEDTSGGPRLTYLGGNSILETGIELRYNLYVSRNPNDVISGMDLAGFFDYGNVWTEHNFKNFSKDLPVQPVAAAGIGTRIRSLVGPVRIDVGYKLINIRKLKVRDVDTQQIRTITKSGAKKIIPFAFQITLGQPF
jgi:outer membrane protein assembly factor BamA